MENTGYYSTTLPLPVSGRRHRGYPADDDPLLARYSALISRNQPETTTINLVEEERTVNPDPPTIESENPDCEQNATGGLALAIGILPEQASRDINQVAGIEEDHTHLAVISPEQVTITRILNNSVEENRNIMESVVPISEIRDDEELSGNGSLADFESPNDQEEPEMAFTGITIGDDDPGILGENEQQTTRGSDRNVAAYLLTLALSLLGVVFVKLKHDNHTPLHIANPFMLLAVIASDMAYMTISILSWIYDHSDYRILKCVYYICCNVAVLSLLTMLFATT